MLVKAFFYSESLRCALIILVAIADIVCVFCTPDEITGISHVVSTFHGAGEKEEAMVVQKSWVEAGNHAKTHLGMDVELVNIILESDKKYDLLSSMTQQHKVIYLDRGVYNLAGLKVPAVGDIFSKLRKHASHRWVVVTNSDIALSKDFYAKLSREIKLYHRPTKRSVENQFNASFSMFKKCISYESACTICVRDAYVLFEHLGGGFELSDNSILMQAFALKLAKLFFAAPRPVERTHSHNNTTCLSKLLQKPAGKYSLSDFLGWLNHGRFGFQLQVPVNASLGRSSVSSSIANRLEEIVEEYHRRRLMFLKSSARPGLAGTITRVNIPTHSSKLTTTYFAQNGKTHPGNDCFFFDRDDFPNEITEVYHPTGVRPWGFWFEQAFNFRNSKRWQWLRISGTPTDVWTYHFGLSTENAESKDILGLTSQWLKVSRYAFGEFFNIPPYCRSIKHWRDRKFCQSGNSRASYCRGVARLSCMYYQHPKSRDQKSFIKGCIERSNGGYRPLKQPLCDFCNFLLRRVGSQVQLGPSFSSIPCRFSYTNCTDTPCRYKPSII